MVDRARHRWAELEYRALDEDTVRIRVPLRQPSGVLRTVLATLGGAAAGSLAMLLVQQGLQQLLFLASTRSPLLISLFGFPSAGFRMDPVGGLGTPLLGLLVLWGAAWGALLGFIYRHPHQRPSLLVGLAFGAVLVGGLSLAIAARSGGQTLMALDGTLWCRYGMLYGAWGWATTLLMLLMPRVESTQRPTPVALDMRRVTSHHRRSTSRPVA